MNTKGFLKKVREQLETQLLVGPAFIQEKRLTLGWGKKFVLETFAMYSGSTSYMGY